MVNVGNAAQDPAPPDCVVSAGSLFFRLDAVIADVVAISLRKCDLFPNIVDSLAIGFVIPKFSVCCCLLLFWILF